MGGSNAKAPAKSNAAEMQKVSNDHYIEQGQHPPLSLTRGRVKTGAFGPVAMVIQVLFIVAFWPTDYDFVSSSVFDETVMYSFLGSILTLLLAGMGFLYAYLRSYGLSAVGMALFQVALGLQWALLVQGWMRQSTIELAFTFKDFSQATMAVFTSVISFGVLAGKLSPLQTLVLVMGEIVCYAGNKVWLLDHVLAFKDNSSSVTVCAFGAYFGLAASLVYGPAKDQVASAMVSGTYVSELFGFLGALIMWINWPSVIISELETGSAAQRMAIMNTIFALLSSTVIAFAATTMPTQRLYTSVALASLAGGVAIGATANLQLRPGWAALIGAVAAGLSCYCFKAPFGNTIPFDTFNINAIFGVPGLFGGFVSVIAPMFVPGCPLDWTKQLGGVLWTFVFAVISGAVTGFVLGRLQPPAVAYTDECYWEPADDIPRKANPGSVGAAFE